VASLGYHLNIQKWNKQSLCSTNNQQIFTIQNINDGDLPPSVTRSPASAGIANRPLVFLGIFLTTLSGHNIEYLCLNLFTLRRFNNNESSGGRQTTFAPIRGWCPQTRMMKLGVQVAKGCHFHVVETEWWYVESFWDSTGTLQTTDVILMPYSQLSI